MRYFRCLFRHPLDIAPYGMLRVGFTYLLLYFALDCGVTDFLDMPSGFPRAQPVILAVLGTHIAYRPSAIISSYLTHHIEAQGSGCFCRRSHGALG